jgi:pyrroloquinoline quinone biosynthesis protein B
VRIIVLGSAAGGGFPQWNCACANCRRGRAGDPAAKPRTQCSLAVSGDGGESWCLLNASPDLRQQILATPALHPRLGPRHSPIRGVVLTNGDIDHVAGLLSLREGQPFTVYATRSILSALYANPMFGALGREVVDRRPLDLGEVIDVGGGLAVEPFAVPGKVPLYLEDGDRPEIGAETEDTIGLRVVGSGGRGGSFFFIPGCAHLTEGLAERLRGARLVFFDGTLYEDDEMVRTGTGTKTGRRMGHMSVAGPDGSLAAFAGLGVGRKIYIHINNTNAILLDDSPERAAVTAAGWEVACDGMEVEVPPCA